jgi:Mor family transcriptional regulator
MSRKSFENLSESNKNDIVNRYKNNETVLSIRNAYNLTYEEFRLILNEKKIEARPMGKLNRLFSDAEEAEIINRYKLGKSIRYLSREYNVDRSVISGILRRNRVEMQSVEFFNIKKKHKQK